MSSAIVYSNIQRYLFIYASLVEQSNSLGLANDAIAAENLFCEFLNKVFSWNLVNANEIKRNQCSFDLIDSGNRIVVQVTSNRDHATKLKATVASFKNQSDRLKIKKLIILFISPKCKTAILKEVKTNEFVYEGYDIPKLLATIWYKNKRSPQLAELQNILQEEIMPVILSQGISGGLIKKEIQPTQRTRIPAKGIYIDRANLIEELFSFCQTDNGLLTGGPGMGKSSIVDLIQQYCHKKNVESFVIRINDLIDGSDEEIQNELNTNIPWLTALNQIVSDKKNKYKSLLIFDAFDTAKDERLKTVVLKHIRNAIEDLSPGWSVLVSARTYDAGKAHRLMELFPEKDITASVQCRHFVIPEFSDLELSVALKQHRTMKEIVTKGTPDLRSLIKIPYFFKLLEKVVVSADRQTSDHLSHIETEDQLLELFWRKEAANTTAKDIFLRNFTEKLLLNEHLSCAKGTIVTDANIAIFDDLISDGILTETSVTRQNISFNHNILLEFAVTKYLLSENIRLLTEYIDGHEKIPFLFRQSFIYFYSKLWKEDKRLFWQHYFKILEINKPVYRLFHQTILNYILAEYYNSLDDLKSIFELPENDQNRDSVRKFLEAIRFVRKGYLLDRDLVLLEAVSQQMTIHCLWELGLLIDLAIKQLTNDRNNILKSKISRASFNYMDFVLAQQKKPSAKGLAERNGGRWAINNICEVLAFNKAAGKYIRQFLGILQEPDFSIDILYCLVDKLIDITHFDVKLGMHIYATLYNHIETSDKPTFMGGSVIMSLQSNRKQDFNVLHHMLESKYPELITINSESFIQFGLEIANRSVGKRKYHRKYEGPFKLEINGIKSVLFSDYSFSYENEDRDYGPFSHVKNIFNFLSELANAHKNKQALNLVKIVFAKTEASGIWNSVFKFFSQFPELFKGQGYHLLTNKSFYICDETVFDTGEYLKAVWPFLTKTKKQKLEKLIADFPVTNLLYDDLEYTEKRIAGLLNNLPAKDLQLKQSHALVKKFREVKNKFAGSSSLLQPYHETEEEKLTRAGVDHKNPNEVTAYDLVKKLDAFNIRFDTNSSDKPPKNDYQPMIPFAEKLLSICQTHRFNERLQYTCDYVVSRFCKIVARNRSKLTLKLRAFIQNTATYYITDPSYSTLKYQGGQLKDRTPGYSPNARTSAAQTFVELLFDDKSGKVAPVITGLLNDNEIIVRLKSLCSVTYFWHNQREEFWRIIKQRSVLESDGGCICMLIKAIYFDDMMIAFRDKIEEIAGILIKRFAEAPESPYHDVWKLFSCLLLKLIINHKSDVAKEIIVSNLGYKEFERALLFEIIRRTLPPEENNNDYIAEPEKYKELIEIILKILTNRFECINSKGLQSDDNRDDFQIIDSVVEKLYFSLSGGRQEKKLTSKISPNAIAFFNTIKPVLSLIAEESVKIQSGFMVAHTGHYFMQIMNLVIHWEPEYSLSTASVIVRCAAANSFTYDRTTLTQVLKFTETILSDHKDLLVNKRHFESLLIMLDLFANSGWQEALEFTWRLKEVF